jgi:hypothetical protein
MERGALWWETEREKGKQGDYAHPKGRYEKILCPQCGEDFVVYNGNYFCDSLAVGECDWALAHRANTKRDREFCDLVGIDYG